ncbi:ABC transporter permease [Paenibacillus antarcticus]|uniref:Sugar ABC transporter permease n=1 Tax=Paenibacillus antarcticus TaxID=253703 RepID=A0A168P4H5_9BACL|nr:ABC transporter permease subunit [Paenibacillus antarcticus]OAB46377.1 sugar ABC transporter permease [Paenibacillus antarcticus]
MESSVHKKHLLKSKRKSFLKQKWLYIMMLLPLTSLIIWNYIPMYGIIIAFKDYSPAFGIMSSPWAGFSHFERFFNAFYFWDVIINTLRISLYSLLVGVPLPIILALMYNELRNKKYKSIVQTISYIPNFISVVIIVGMVTFFTSPVDGVINSVIEYFGGAPIDFIGNSKLFPHVFVWSGIWQAVGWGTLIYTAAMSGIPQDQYEAAYLEGASRMQCILNITIPAIMPTIMICTILATGSVMSVGFEKVLLMQNDANLATSEVLSTYMYKSGIVNAEYSFSAAVGLFNNLINFIVLYVVNKFAQKFSETSLW